MNISTIIRTLIMTLPVILVVGCDEQINQHGTPSFDYFYLKGSNGESMQKASYEITASSSSWSPELSIVSTLPISEIETYSNQMWLTSSKNNNSDLTLSATFNNSIEPRYGSIRLSTPDNKHDFYFYVTQRGRDLSISNDGISIGNGASISIPTTGGESLTYEVSADGEYTITKAANDSWYTVTHSKENNTFYVSATENPSNTVREGQITVAIAGLPTGESLEIKVIVQQNPTALSGSRFIKATELILDRRYLLVCDSKHACACPLSPSEDMSYLSSDNVNIENGLITQKDNNNAFTFATSATIDGKTYNLSNGQFMIVDSNNRYYYVPGSWTLFHVSDTPTILDGEINPDYIFTANRNSENLWLIQRATGRWIQYRSANPLWAICTGIIPGYELPSLYIQEY